MKVFAQSIQRLKQMPETLAGLSCAFMLFGSISIILAVLPSTGWTCEGQPVSYQEFWRSGGGVFVVAVGVAMILFAVAFYRAQHWVQSAIPLGFVALTVYSAFRPGPFFPFDWAGAFSWAFLSYWYFNRKRNVVDYFSGTAVAEQGH